MTRVAIVSAVLLTMLAFLASATAPKESDRSAGKVLIGAAVPPASVPEPRPAFNGCSTPELRDRSVPTPAGPARLQRFDCLNLPRIRLHYDPPVLSPDGKRFLVYGHAEGLFVGTLADGTASASYELDPTFVQFSSIAFSQSDLVFHWASDSKSIWTADQQTGAHHFATGPLEPVLIQSDGSQKMLPALHLGAGSLDGLMWIGGNGLALAKFGTNGGYYRPEHSDSNPTLAFVDALHGHILDSISLKAIAGARSAQGKIMAPLVYSATRLPSGHVKAFLQWPTGASLLWTQGAPPVEISFPKLPWLNRIAITPDGGKLLVSYPLSASGMICETWSRRTCPPPTPATGKLAALIDIETGTALWHLEGTAKSFESYPPPAVSPDGRYALIGIPEQDGRKIALISMQDGRTLQTMPRLWSTSSLSFSADSRLFFISGGRFVATYDLANR